MNATKEKDKTLDELKRLIDSQKHNLESSNIGFTEFKKGFDRGLEIANIVIETNRSSLEAGMRGTLRFRIHNIKEHSLQMDLLTHKDEQAWFEGLRLYTMVQFNDADSGIAEAKRIGTFFAQSQGMTAEFEGGLKK